jgi:hypothetical protein
MADDPLHEQLLFLPKLFLSAFPAKTSLPIYRKSFAFMKKKGGRAAVPTLRLFPRFRLIRDDRGDEGESFQSLAFRGASVGARMSKFLRLNEKICLNSRYREWWSGQ